MLKKRIIPVQLLIKGRLVKTIQFGSYRDVGNPVSSSKIYNDTDADELIFINIDHDERTIDHLISLIQNVSEVCFMPISIGGGIQSFEDARKLIKSGADKVIINSAVYENKKLIEDIANVFGSQAVVVSIDAKKNYAKNKYQLFSNCGRELEEVDLEEHVSSCIDHGAGEIFINSIDNDGVMNGFDLDLISRVVACSKIPVIGCGGAGNSEHILKCFTETGVGAIACGSLFNFGDNNPIRVKAFLSNYNIPLKVI